MTLALLSPYWKHSIDVEMIALHKNQSQDSTTLHPGKQTIGCLQVYVIKFQSFSQTERLNAWKQD